MTKIGTIHSRWLIIGCAQHRRTNRYWLCQCECGTVREVSQADLRRGSSKSCGCLMREVVGTRTTLRNTSHGMSDSAAYRVWQSMKSRCENPKNKSYNDYGGRGIGVCEQWSSFAAFVRDMGLPPNGLSIERVDNERGYSKDNCIWATRRRQSRNKRNTAYVDIAGETLCFSDACAKIGILKGTALSLKKDNTISHQETLNFYVLRQINAVNAVFA
jgi:hypothetical protein